tara:strand:- start:274 stop:642 length:369 start_codon:yes stop_codon:yes gene_type:complete
MKKNKFPIKYTSLNIVKTKKNKIINKINKNNLLRKFDIEKNFVVIKVEYANLNYKDFLMSQGHSGLIKKFPHTPGIDAAGTIYHSNSKKFKKKRKSICDSSASWYRVEWFFITIYYYTRSLD